MKKPTKKELIEMLEKVCYKLNEHQKEDSKILKGYTLAANVEGLTELLNESTCILAKA